MSYRKGDIPKVTIDRIKIGGKELTEEVANNILSGKFDLGIEKIAKDIVKRQDNAIAMEFTKCIGELLRKNGVTPKITEYQKFSPTFDKIGEEYGVTIDELDFSEHDKVFEDKIARLEKRIAKMEDEKKYLRMRCMEDATDAFDRGSYGALTIIGRRVKAEEENRELKKHIAELESRETSDLPFDPLECANYLINATYERETNGIERTFHNLPDKVNSDRYTVDDLEQIAEHLLIYCKHNKDFENDGK